MGIIGKVTANTVGTDLADTTAAKAEQTWKEALELLGAAADEVGGDNAKRSLEVALQVRGLAEELHNRVDYSSGRAKLNLSSAPTPTAPALTAADTAVAEVQASVSTEASEAEKLGDRLLKAFGNNPVDANNVVQFVERAIAQEQRFFPFMYQVFNALTRNDHPDQLVDAPGGGSTLKSLVDLRTAKDEADKGRQAFEQLFKDLFAGAVPAGDINGNLRDARDEIKTLKKNVSPDTISEAVKTASGIEKNPTETVSAYLTRVIENYRKAVVNLYDEIKTQSGVETRTNEPMADYIGRVQVKLLQGANAAYSQLLNDIGTAARRNRDGMTDTEYRADLLKVVDKLWKSWDGFVVTHEALKKVAQDNGIPLVNHEGTLGLTARIINHGRRMGKLDVSAASTI